MRKQAALKEAARADAEAQVGGSWDVVVVVGRGAQVVEGRFDRCKGLAGIGREWGSMVQVAWDGSG